MAERVDVVVIGAGIVGAAVARAFGRRGRSVLLLEQHGQAGTETTSRNSEVVHAGLYYPTGSLKARFCVEGKRLLYEYCREREIPHRRCGKLIVATHRRQLPTLLRLQAQACANGVTDTTLLSNGNGNSNSNDQIRALEPELDTCIAALHSPSTGIVDSHALLQHILADSANQPSCQAQTEHVMNATVTNGRHAGSTDLLQVQVDHELWLNCTTVVNCAGLHAPAIANLFLQDADADRGRTRPPLGRQQRRRHYFAKGNYFRLVRSTSSSSSSSSSSTRPFSRLIYPVPEPPGGLGIHATVDLQGSIRFGPDVEWIDPAIVCPQHIDLRPSMDRVQHFYDAIRQYWPALPDGCLEPDYVGIRPKLHHPSVPLSVLPPPPDDDNGTGDKSASSSPPLLRPALLSFQDFCIEGPATHGIKGLINLLGIESPGLTSCFAIAEYCTALDAMQ